jgi:hypothetical protein
MNVNTEKQESEQRRKQQLLAVAGVGAVTLLAPLVLPASVTAGAIGVGAKLLNTVLANKTLTTAVVSGLGLGASGIFSDDKKKK